MTDIIEFCPFCGGNEIMPGEAPEMGFCHGCKHFFGVSEYERWEWNYLNQKIRMIKRNAVILKDEAEGKE